MARDTRGEAATVGIAIKREGKLQGEGAEKDACCAKILPACTGDRAAAFATRGRTRTDLAATEPQRFAGEMMGDDDRMRDAAR